MISIKDLKENNFIHTPTKKEALILLSIFDDLGFKWGNGDIYTDISTWHNHKEKTIYNPFDGSYGNAKTTLSEKTYNLKEIIEYYEYINNVRLVINPKIGDKIIRNKEWHRKKGNNSISEEYGTIIEIYKSILTVDWKGSATTIVGFERGKYLYYKEKQNEKEVELIPGKLYMNKEQKNPFIYVEKTNSEVILTEYLLNTINCILYKKCYIDNTKIIKAPKKEKEMWLEAMKKEQIPLNKEMIEVGEIYKIKSYNKFYIAKCNAIHSDCITFENWYDLEDIFTFHCYSSDVSTNDNVKIFVSNEIEKYRYSCTYDNPCSELLTKTTEEKKLKEIKEIAEKEFHKELDFDRFTSGIFVENTLKSKLNILAINKTIKVKTEKEVSIKVLKFNNPLKFKK